MLGSDRACYLQRHQNTNGANNVTHVALVEYVAVFTRQSLHPAPLSPTFPAPKHPCRAFQCRASSFQFCTTVDVVVQPTSSVLK